ncbi:MULTISPECIES: HAD family hydrolase [Parachlamydia]|jgi:phosphoglycolate phosphatase-like HAD superfamily hydrolase|nr:HAD family hydrolase [Parachlamydia acanthamoebae]EFB41662.1 hypothetical protein pah_c026o103 [Parachlamydia acanthamoebae str. Hall's coccus]
MKHISLVYLLFFYSQFIIANNDLLPSWTDGPTKSAILHFVEETTQKDHPHYIPVEERIATFDQDGTLWVEQPLNTQLFFAIDHIKLFAPQHPDWKEKEPFKTILMHDVAGLKAFDEREIEQIIAVTHANMTVHEYKKAVQEWLQKAIHPHFKKPFTELVYQPMLEVIQLLQKHGFKTYIVSGSGQEFIRAYAEKIYGIPPEHVIGSASKVKYIYQNDCPALLKLSELLFVDDKAGKPEAISLIIGRRPFAAFGNSIGDREMLEWTQAGCGKRLALLVYHNDAIREYAYGPNSKIGTFSFALMEEAKKRGWLVVSMKDDWKMIFAWESPCKLP